MGVLALVNHYSGKILCRLRSESQDIRALGDYLQEHTTRYFVPYFVVRDSTHTFEPFQILITEEAIQNMKRNALFDVEAIRIPTYGESTVTNISFCMSQGEEVPISGFPRTLTVKEPLTSMS